jgi:membrane-associated protein
MLHSLMDWVFHLDTHLAALASTHGAMVYAVLFGFIFVETGVVIMPFLPGDSLLFVAGALAAEGTFSLPVLVPVLVAAAIGGDTLNFAIGSVMRKHVLDARRVRFVKQEYLERTQGFFDRHGRKTIVLARFVPVVRTLAPFVAALGKMPYPSFLVYNVVGGLAWVGIVLGAGYAFGNLPWVSQHLTAVVLGIVFISVLPGIIGWAKGRAQKSAESVR